jgi:hypothetical protein
MRTDFNTHGGQGGFADNMADERRWGGRWQCESRIPSAASQVSRHAGLYADAPTRGAQGERMLIVIDCSLV